MGYISDQSMKSIIEIYKHNKEPWKLKSAAIRDVLQTPITDANPISQKSITLKRGLKFWDMPYYQFVATVGAEIADALTYAHQNGIVHGDLKPTNILLTHEAIPMVVDFGLSRNIKKIASSKATEFTGTLAYASPEQIKDNTINEKTDIWSLGVTLYELLTFRNPFSASTIKQTADKILKDNPPTLRNYSKRIPVELEAIVLKCLELNPRDRYGSIAELSRDLNNFLESKPTIARPVGLIKRTGKAIRRHPLISLLTIILACTAVMSTFLYFNKQISDSINEGVKCYNQGNDDKALFNYNRALELIKVVPFSKYHQKEILCNIGDTVGHKGEYEKAINIYLEVYKGDPGYPQALLGLASTYEECGRYDEAIRYCNEGIKLYPNDRDNYYWLGKALAGKGLFDDAIEAYLKAVKLAPDDAETLNEIVSVLNKKGVDDGGAITEYLTKKGLSTKQIRSALPH